MRRIMQALRTICKYLFTDFDYSIEFDYERYWGNRTEQKNLLPIHKYRLVANLLPSGCNVLDLGCGDESLLKYLREHKNINGKGIDVSRKAIQIGQSKGLDIILGDISDPKFHINETYDYILLLDVLEHLPNPEVIMSKVKGKFRKSIIILIPNTGFIIDRLRLLF